MSEDIKDVDPIDEPTPTPEPNPDPVEPTEEEKRANELARSRNLLVGNGYTVVKTDEYKRTLEEQRNEVFRNALNGVDEVILKDTGIEFDKETHKDTNGYVKAAISSLLERAANGSPEALEELKRNMGAAFTQKQEELEARFAAQIADKDSEIEKLSNGIEERDAKMKQNEMLGIFNSVFKDEAGEIIFKTPVMAKAFKNMIFTSFEELYTEQLDSDGNVVYVGKDGKPQLDDSNNYAPHTYESLMREHARKISRDEYPDFFKKERRRSETKTKAEAKKNDSAVKSLASHGIFGGYGQALALKMLKQPLTEQQEAALKSTNITSQEKIKWERLAKQAVDSINNRA